VIIFRRIRKIIKIKKPDLKMKEIIAEITKGERELRRW